MKHHQRKLSRQIFCTSVHSMKTDKNPTYLLPDKTSTTTGIYYFVECRSFLIESTVKGSSKPFVPSVAQFLNQRMFKTE